MMNHLEALERQLRRSQTLVYEMGGKTSAAYDTLGALLVALEERGCDGFDNELENTLVLVQSALFMLNDYYISQARALIAAAEVQATELKKEADEK